MIISCSECGIRYRVDEGRLSDQTRIFRCSHCGEILRHKPSSENSPTTPPTQPQSLLVSCPDCGTKYRINAERLSGGKSDVRCRNCDRIFPLQVQQASRSLQVRVIRTDQPESQSPAASQPQFQTYTGKPNSSKKKKILLAFAAAAVLALSITGLFFGYPILFRERTPQRSISKAPDRPALTPADAVQQPLVLLKAELPALRRQLQPHLPVITEDLRWRLATSILDSAGLQQAKVFLYPDSEYQILPVLVLQGNESANVKTKLLSTGLLERFLTPAEGEAYRFNPGVLDIAAKNGFPADSYRVWVHTNWIVCAPMKQSHLWKDGTAHWLSFSVVEIAETFGKPVELAAMAVRIPEDLPPGWTNALIPAPLHGGDPGSEPKTHAAANFMVLLDRSLRQIDLMAGMFRFVDQKGRLLQYMQRFRQSADGNQVFTRLQSDRNQDDRTSMGTIFSKLLHHDRLNTTVELRDNRLTVDLEWQAEDDQVLLQAVTEAVFGPNRSEGTTEP